MKNKGKIFGLFLATGLALAGCDKNNENKKEDENKKHAYSDAEKKVCSDYFYGVEIPYMYFEGETELTYDAAKEAAYKTATTCTKEMLDAYGAMFDDSWSDYSELGADEYGNENYVYYFEKSVSTENGDRYVAVCFYASTYSEEYETDIVSLSGNGTFNMEVSDPYDYAWPTDTFAALFELFGFTSEVPAYEDGYLYMIDYGFGNVDVFALTEDTNAYQNYAKTLIDAGYSFSYTTSSGFDLYVNENLDIYVGVCYYDDAGGLEVNIAGYYIIDDEWPTDFVSEALEAIDATSTFPAYTDGYEYEVDDYVEDGGFGIFCYTEDAECFGKYEEALTAAGYVYEDEDEYGYACYSNETGDIIVSIAYDEEYASLNIYVDATSGFDDGEEEFDLVTSTEWPADFIASALEEFDAISTVPAYEDAEEYEYCGDYIEDGYFFIFCYVDNENAAQDYGNLLEAANYVYDGDDEEGYSYFYNENEDIYINFAYLEEYGSLDIYVCMFDEDDSGSGYVEVNADGDQLNQKAFGMDKSTSSSYVEYKATCPSGAEYTAVASSDKGIQLTNKTGKNSGLVCTKSAGKLKSIVIDWGSTSTSERAIDIYASNEPFTIADMSSGKVTKVGTIVCGITNIYEFAADYTYFGLLSSKGAVNPTTIVVSWQGDDSQNVEDNGGQQGEGQQGEGQQGEGSNE